MSEFLAYFKNVLGQAFHGSLSVTSALSFIAFILGPPAIGFAFGYSGVLSPAESLWLGVGLYALVLVGRIFLATFWVNSETQANADKAGRELDATMDYRHKLDVLREVRNSTIARMNQPIEDGWKAAQWCTAHDAWLPEVEAKISNEVSPADAHTIFVIGDASLLPAEPFIFSEEYAAKMCWTRCYSNRLREVIDQYRQAEFALHSRHAS